MRSMSYRQHGFCLCSAYCCR